MTHDDLSAYLDILMDEMWLGRWRIKIVEVDSDFLDGDYAQCFYAKNGHEATFALREDWADWAPEVLRHVLVHELVHCYMAGIEPAHELAKPHLAPATFDVFSNAMLHAVERSTDLIAGPWASLLPLPDLTNSAPQPTIASTIITTKEPN